MYFLECLFCRNTNESNNVVTLSQYREIIITRWTFNFVGRTIHEFSQRNIYLLYLILFEMSTVIKTRN